MTTPPRHLPPRLAREAQARGLSAQAMQAMTCRELSLWLLSQPGVWRPVREDEPPSSTDAIAAEMERRSRG